MEKMDSNIIWQIAIVVKDIEKSVKNYAEIFGLELPEIIDGGVPEDTNIQYRNKPSCAGYKMAFFKMGLIQLELIEPSEGESSWREFLDRCGEGVHHIAFSVNNVEESIKFLEGKGLNLVQKGEFKGGSYHYIDAISKLGFIMELSQKKKMK